MRPSNRNWHEYYSYPLPSHFTACNALHWVSTNFKGGDGNHVLVVYRQHRAARLPQYSAIGIDSRPTAELSGERDGARQTVTAVITTHKPFSTVLALIHCCWNRSMSDKGEPCVDFCNTNSNASISLNLWRCNSNALQINILCPNYSTSGTIFLWKFVRFEYRAVF
jgi:hypothetical protein